MFAIILLSTSSVSSMFSIVSGCPHSRLFLVLCDSNTASCAERIELA
jgi:hypothetical protein